MAKKDAKKDQKNKDESKTLPVKLQSVNFNGPTCSIGVAVARTQFEDVNECDSLLTCTELHCVIEGDPASTKGEPTNQEAFEGIDTKEKAQFIARTGATSLKREDVSFTLQISRKSHEDQCHIVSRLSKKECRLTVTRIAQLSEDDADGKD